MARKKTALQEPEGPAETAPAEAPQTTTSPTEGNASESAPPSDTNGNGEPPIRPGNGDKKRPAFKVGPLATGKGESVAGCVWENEHVAEGRTYVVHSIVLDVSYFSEKEGKWLPSRGIRPSQLAAVEYVLRVCGDFAFRR